MKSLLKKDYNLSIERGAAFVSNDRVHHRIVILSLPELLEDADKKTHVKPILELIETFPAFYAIIEHNIKNKIDRARVGRNYDFYVINK